MPLIDFDAKIRSRPSILVDLKSWNSDAPLPALLWYARPFTRLAIEFRRLAVRPIAYFDKVGEVSVLLFSYFGEGFSSCSSVSRRWMESIGETQLIYFRSP